MAGEIQKFGAFGSCIDIEHDIQLILLDHVEELLPGGAADIFHLQPGPRGFNVHEIDRKAAWFPVLVKVEWWPVQFVVNPDGRVFLYPGSFFSRQR